MLSIPGERPFPSVFSHAVLLKKNRPPPKKKIYPSTKLKHLEPVRQLLIGNTPPASLVILN